jgi:hypothetical protein
MFSRDKRLDLFKDYVLERRCPLCSHLPRAERPEFREELNCIPIKGTCLRCFLAFVKNISDCEPEPPLTKH